MSSQEYYASPNVETKEAANKVMSFVKWQQTKLHGGSGIGDLWNRNLASYYRNSITDTLDFAGEQGELVSMSVPQARSLVRQTVSVVCKQKLNFKSLQHSSDYATMASSKIADALARKIVLSQDLDQLKDKNAETAYVQGTAFWYVEWDPEAGEQVKGAANFAKTGDVKISSLSPQYVYYDMNAQRWQDLLSITVAVRANRYDLMAQHPELEKEILGLPKFNREFSNSKPTLSHIDQDDGIHDLVLVYYHYHKPSPASPLGRMLILGEENCVFHDGPNPYECLPVFPNMPEKLDDYLIGYPQYCNLAPLQEMYDHNFSVIASNQSAFGVQTILHPRGSNLDINQISGMQWVAYNPQSIDGGGKPEALQLTRTAPEIFEMLQTYKNTMGELANINGALRGQPPAGITAGNAIATLTANSIEFLTSFSLSLYTSISHAVTFAIKCYRMFGPEDQLVTIADGKTAYAMAFKSSELSNFDKVSLDIVNPALATYSGRQNDAEMLLQSGLIKDTNTYFRIKEGAPLEIMYETQLSELGLIQKENDDLSVGTPCPVLFNDTHPQHIEHHNALLFNPEIRRNGQYLQVILDHIAQHSEFDAQKQAGLMAQQSQPQAPNVGPSSAQSIQPGQGPSAPASPAQPKVSL